MKLTFTFIFIIGLILNARSQNDTIYIKRDSILLLGNYYNRVVDGSKTGLWVEFHASGIFEIVGCHDDGPGLITCKYSYKNLINKTAGYDTVIVEKEIHGELITYTEYVKYFNKIEPENYVIIGRGQYQKNYKHGTWTYYYKDGNIKSKINYQDGIPINDFDILYSSGSVKITVKNIKGSKWNVCTYLPDGHLIECEDYLIENINFLY